MVHAKWMWVGNKAKNIEMEKEKLVGTLKLVIYMHGSKKKYKDAIK